MIRDNYKSWEVNVTNTPRGASLRDQLQLFVSFAILAPSGHNTQPWQFAIGKDFIDIFVVPERSLSQSDPHGRQLSIAMGCALENLRIAADYFGFDASTKYFPDDKSPLLFVRVLFRQSKPISNDSKHLVFSIPKRRTNRNKYEDRTLPKEFVESIKKLSNETLRVDIVTNDAQRNILADLANNAQIESMDSPSFREELSHYVKSSSTKEKFGMTGATLLMPAFLSYFASRLIKKVNVSRLSRKKDDALLKKFTPAFLVISVAKDDKINWMKAGELFERIWLIAEREGISCSPMAGCVQLKSYREKVKQILHINDTPLIFSRIGYAKKITPHSPRYRLHDVLK